ncbi:MAG: acyl carrier protein [Fibrobacterota bacterium]|nr:acyl carrier protein [Chitinispirillaceae bacterium]
MVDNSEIQEKLLLFICRNYIVDREDINLDQSLVDQGIIDSFGLVEISGFFKTEFNVVVAENEMTRANFGSVLKMVDFVKRKTEA